MSPAGLSGVFRGRGKTTRWILLALAFGPGAGDRLPAQTKTADPPVELYANSADIEAAGKSFGSDIGSVHQADPLPCGRGRRGEFAAAPIPMVNPTLGDGLGAAVLYLTNLEPCQDRLPPSVFALGGFRTNNGSWALGGGANLILGSDRYRITMGGGTGELHYRFFGIGNEAGVNGQSIEVTQKVSVWLAEPKVRVGGRWFVGPRYHRITSTIASDSATAPGFPELPAPDLKLRTAALGIRVQNDHRDSTFYPRTGYFFDVKSDFFEPAFGGRRSYRTVQAAFNQFFGFGLKNVLAVHGGVCATWGSPPFYDLCQLGMSQDLRGYEIGRYRDRRFVAVQAEYRRELFWRLGAVAFMGAGEVGRTITAFTLGNILPGGGVGMRLALAKKTHVNLRVDYALGRDSHALYVGIGEAF